MITEYRRERERERERETDMCESSQRKPLEAKVLNLALRSDESDRFLVGTRYFSNIMLSLTGGNHASDLPHRQWHHRKHNAGKRCKKATYTEIKLHVERKKVFICPVY